MSILRTDAFDAAAVAQRAESAAPTWQNYQEDIKAQIGAGPVARWSGEPVSAAYVGGAVTVEFAVRGAWTDVRAAMPVLLRDPYGNVHLGDAAETGPGRVRYAFQLGLDPETGPLPWAELRYPSHERRLMFDAEGRWTARDAPAP